MIAIIDYNCGNILSVKNIIKKAGHKSILTNNPLEISKADKIILPGVGAFDYGMNKLKEYNLIDPIIQHVKSKKPMLGICLGMQLMTNPVRKEIQMDYQLWMQRLLNSNQ